MAYPLNTVTRDDFRDQVIPPIAAAEQSNLEAAEAPSRTEKESLHPLPRMLQTVAERHGKPLQQVVFEMAKFGFGPGKITIDDYFALRLFDDDALKGVDKRTFAGPRAFSAIEADINYNKHWLVATGHKLVTEALMRGFGFPVARTKAVHSVIANYPAFTSLKTAARINAYLADESNYPLFCKPIDASASVGTFALDGFDPATRMLRLSNGRLIALDSFVSDIVSRHGDGYLFQERLLAHPDVIRLCGDRIPTIRFYTINGPDGPEMFRAVWLIPTGDSVAATVPDQNILAAIDYRSGRIVRAITGNALDQRDVEFHPDTGTRIMGFEIPDWHESRDMVLEAAKALDELPLIGWDIAPTADGGVILEASDRPDFMPVQRAERRGILESSLLEVQAWAKDVRRQIKKITAERSQTLKRKVTQRILDAMA